MTVHFNPLTQEPYLRLPEPHSNLIITPHRVDRIDETVDRQVEFLNDPRVYKWLETTPYPYLREHGEQWTNACCNEYKEILSILRGEFAKGGGIFRGRREVDGLQKSQQFFDACPFTCIREVLAFDTETGAPLKDNLIGDVKLGRYTFYEHPLGSEERAQARRENDALPAGDGNIVWTLGDWLAPTHHGKGIMTLAMKSLLGDWAVPYMNVRNLKAYLFKGNTGSLRVFEKINCEEDCILEDWVPVDESRGGGRKSIVVMRWKGLLW